MLQDSQELDKKLKEQKGVKKKAGIKSSL